MSQLLTEEHTLVLAVNCMARHIATIEAALTNQEVGAEQLDPRRIVNEMRFNFNKLRAGLSVENYAFTMDNECENYLIVKDVE